MEIEALYTKKVKCPVCKIDFNTSKMRTSKIRIDKVESDFMNYYKSENPIKYHVFVCPHCGYAALESNFSNIKPAAIEIINKNITSRWNKREYSGERTNAEAIECYKLALYCGQLSGLKKIELGNIALKISWFYREEEKFEEEKRFMSNALELFEQGFFTEDLSNSSFDEIKLGYLIGELYRRLGNEKEAIKWFEKTISNPLIKNNPRIEKMTREQWSLAKEKYCEEK